MKTTVITGSAGQDGTYLAAHLATRGDRIIGIDRPPGSLDLGDTSQVFDLVQQQQPDEVYHLAAFHHSAQDPLTDDLDIFQRSHQVQVLATANLLEAIRRFCPTARLFYAASCHGFGRPTAPIQDETTPFQPECLYGITKVTGSQLCHFYRQTHQVFASVGILYNHESPLRPSHFVSKKIVEAAVRISRQQQEKLVLGDLDVAIDWGYAGDYVVAMQQILQLAAPGDFVIASGEPHQVRDFVAEAFRLVGLDWQPHVEVDPNLVHRRPRVNLVGNHAKLTRLTGWRPMVGFRELVKLMVQAELKQHDRH